MAEQFLHGADVVAGHEQVCGEAVAQGVGRRRFRQTRIAHRLLDGPLYAFFVGVMAAGDAGAGIDRQLPGREHVLPAPLALGVGVFSLQGIGQIDRAVTRAQILFVQAFDPRQVALQRLDQGERERRDAIFSAFAVAHQHFPPLEVDILDPQPHAFHQAHPRSIQQIGHQPMGSAQAIQHDLDFGVGQHDRQPLWSLGLLHVIQPRQFLVEDFFIEKQQGAASLVLGGCRHVAPHR